MALAAQVSGWRGNLPSEKTIVTMHFLKLEEEFYVRLHNGIIKASWKWWHWKWILVSESEFIQSQREVRGKTFPTERQNRNTHPEVWQGMEGSGMVSPGWAGRKCSAVGWEVAEAPGKFFARGCRIKEMYENNAWPSWESELIEEDSPEVGYSRLQFST